MAEGTQMSEGEVQDRITDYESFLNEKIRRDLRELQVKRDHIYDDIAEFKKLESSIEAIKTLQTHSDSLETKVDLGNGFFCDAMVPSTEFVYVDVGFGFHVQYTLDEAIHVCKSKEDHLSKRAETLSKKIAETSAMAKVVRDALGQLQDTLLGPV
eukprot:m.170364 g.170364  ORF g.170364 m.170364 type:complete len:155 (+) comp14528_c0_seq5:582-1046(+)